MRKEAKLRVGQFEERALARSGEFIGGSWQFLNSFYHGSTSLLCQFHSLLTFTRAATHPTETNWDFWKSFSGIFLEKLLNWPLNEFAILLGV